MNVIRAWFLPCSLVFSSLLFASFLGANNIPIGPHPDPIPEKNTQNYSFPTSRPAIIYVKDGVKNGKGKSWGDAFNNLQDALQAAKKGQQIWVAGGTYFPSKNDDRNAVFHLVEGVSLYGGFAGSETSLEEIDPQTNETILSGEIGTSSPEDNSYTIIYAEELTAATVISGFIISGAQANGTNMGVHRNTCGAAWFNVNSSPSIINCTFKENSAREGAAIYNYAGKGGESSPQIINCTFLDNKADLDGGSIFNNGNDGKCMPMIVDCYFENNIASYGAGILNTARNGITRPYVLRCKFFKNKSLIRGNSIYNHRDNTGLCTTQTKDVIFDED